VKTTSRCRSFEKYTNENGDIDRDYDTDHPFEREKLGVDSSEPDQGALQAL
jgi:hypothetical protein